MGYIFTNGMFIVRKCLLVVGEWLIEGSLYFWFSEVENENSVFDPPKERKKNGLEKWHRSSVRIYSESVSIASWILLHFVCLTERFAIWNTHSIKKNWLPWNVDGKANQFFFCFVYHSSNSIIAALVLASALVFVYCKVGFGILSSPNKLIVWKWKHRNDVELHSPKGQQTKTTSELQRHKNKTVTATDK